MSSMNSFSVRIQRPLSRTRMMASAKHVHHHDTSSVGLFVAASCAAGGSEYMSRRAMSWCMYIVEGSHCAPLLGSPCAGGGERGGRMFGVGNREPKLSRDPGSPRFSNPARHGPTHISFDHFQNLKRNSRSHCVYKQGRLNEQTVVANKRANKPDSTLMQAQSNGKAREGREDSKKADSGGGREMLITKAADAGQHVKSWACGQGQSIREARDREQNEKIR